MMFVCAILLTALLASFARGGWTSLGSSLGLSRDCLPHASWCFEAWARCSRNLEILMLPLVSLGFLMFRRSAVSSIHPQPSKIAKAGAASFGWRRRESKAGHPHSRDGVAV